MENSSGVSLSVTAGGLWTGTLALIGLNENKSGEDFLLSRKNNKQRRQRDGEQILQNFHYTIKIWPEKSKLRKKSFFKE